MSLTPHRRCARGLFLASLMLMTEVSRAGDILRGGAPMNSRNAPGNSSATTATVDQSRARFQDSLARTSKAITAVQALQNAARQQAAIKGVNNLGAGLPVVVDGLRSVTNPTGGLDYIGKKAGYEAASDDPVEKVSNGHIDVTVKQNLQQAFLEWRTFNIGRGTTLTFDQSKGGADVGKWVAFNEVLDPSASPTQILGQIKAAGQVYIINQNGIIFGGASQVNTHTLVASSLPINTNLVSRGLLNNPDNQFLFSALKIDAGKNGTPAFDPADPLGGKIGDVIVQAGATLTAPTSAAKVGGRVALIGPNVSNAGTINTPDGQTILAAGLQVGFAAHDSSDPSTRGLDVYIGKVSDPSVLTFATDAGTATNTGIISIPRGNLTMAGKTIEQLGVVNSSTSVSLNGSVKLDASFDAIANIPGNNNDKRPFLPISTGTIELGAGSAIQILPESTTEKVVGTQLALPTKIDIRGKVVHFGTDADILAPNANVTVNAGTWNLLPSVTQPSSSFVRTVGQVYLDSGASINVSGSTDASAPLTENILTLQLRGSEFADSTLNRHGAIRGVDITLDVRRQGVYNGFAWVGTPLADASGFVGIIDRTASELTTAGGTVSINAGGSVVMQSGSQIDVSGGWVNYTGGTVKTTRVIYRGNIFDIADAFPNVVYDGIYTGTSTFTHSRWGVSNTYTTPFMLGEHYDPGYVYGMAGGKIDVSAPSMAMDGALLGNTLSGPRQRELPAQPSTLNLTFMGEKLHTDGFTVLPYTPHAPNVILQSGISQRPAEAFTLDLFGNPADLRDDRKDKVYLSPDAIAEGGFGFVKVSNSDGNVTLAAGESLTTPAMGSVELDGANVKILGDIHSPSGAIILNAYNISPIVAATLALMTADDPLRITPPPSADRGTVTVAGGGHIDASGLLVDDRLSSPHPLSLPLVLTGGSVNISGYNVSLQNNSEINVSGGARLDWLGKSSYGNAGSIEIKAGRDLTIPAVLGGRLNLGTSLVGLAGQGSKGGSLSVSAPFIQIGGASSNTDTLVLQPEFFNMGGFASFAFTGVGSRSDNSKTPAVSIAPGTEIAPVPANQIIVPFAGGKNGLDLKQVLFPEGMRSQVSLSFNTPRQGETYSLSPVILVRGDFVMGEGSSINAGPLGAIGFKGSTVTIFGDVFAPGGSISVVGANSFPTLGILSNPLPTVYVGPQAHLSTAGKIVLTPDAYGRRIGTILPGGTISIAGNIVLEAGSVLDSSGASGVLDIAPAYLGLDANADAYTGTLRVPDSSGLTTPKYAFATVPTQINSDGGLISLTGGELLLSRAELRGNAGGRNATGGTLLISSGRFYPAGGVRLPSDSNLTVSQSGTGVPGSFFSNGQSAVGQTLAGLNGGYFAVNDFNLGGFDSLQLGGNVRFVGPISINARSAISVANGGFLYADDTVLLRAPYIALGTTFLPPFQLNESVQPFTLNGTTYNFAPTSGNGRLIVTADLIEVGNLTLGGINNARLVADEGNIRGDGTFSMAGDLYMRAGQVYPVTGTTFTVAAYDPLPGTAGSVTFERSGTLDLPLSAGGTLNVYASSIVQNGVLRAPFGRINLGWDGTGTAPVNLVVGTQAALPTTQTITLGAGSVTSVSAIDPLTGQGVLIPYGRFNAQDGTWIGPNGQNVTVAGLPQKNINISSVAVDSLQGSTIDIRGGGDLYAYNWSPSLLGTRDLLGSATSEWNSVTQYTTGAQVTYKGQTWSARQSGSGHTPNAGFFWTLLPEAYAVLPGYDDFASPFAAFNARASSLLSDPGYTSTKLHIGDLVQLGASTGLAAGTYTLLPARYALLPGAFMVTPQNTAPIGTFLKPDGATFVNGYRYNGLNSERDLQPIYSRWEVVPASVLRDRAAYTDYLANTLFPTYAAQNNIAVQRLPRDSGQLVLSAVSAMILNGSVLAHSLGGGRGGAVDITSSTADIIIGTADTPLTPGTLVLNAAQLSSFGADSLLIGGTRVLGSDSDTLTVNTTSLTVSNGGSPLTGPEIILASKGSLSLDPTAIITQTGALGGTADTIVVSGPGALVRVSADANALTIRSGVSGSTGSVGLTVESGATISGNSLTLDSTGNHDIIGNDAVLNGTSITINSGIMRLLLSGSGPTNPGLVIGSAVLDQFANAKSLSLLSYSTMDLYGEGGIGGAALANLSIHAAAIRRQSGTGIASFTAQNILLDNSANITIASSSLTGTSAGTLEFDANKLTLGANQVQIAKFSNLVLNASAGIFLSGAGGLSTPGNISGTAPFIVASQRASAQSLTAGGTFTLDGVPGVTLPREQSGLGSSLSISGTTVTLGSDIIAPSGIVNLTATAGALTVNGSIDAAGTKQTLYDVTRYTDGGDVNLSATGDLTLSSGSTVNVSAASGGGNAGSLAISVPNGVLDLSGALLGSAGTGGIGGSFALDTKALATLSTVNSVVAGAGFNNTLAYRVRTGEVTIDGTTLARNFSLSADADLVRITGLIDVSGTSTGAHTGGSISISAFKGLTLEGLAKLDASATQYNNAGKGGSIFLETRGNAGGVINLAATSQIDLSVTLPVGQTAAADNFTGTLHLRAPQILNGVGDPTGILISPVNSSITGASSIIAEGFKVYTPTGGLIQNSIADVLSNGNKFGALAGGIESTLLNSNNALSPIFTVRVGAELINSTGDLVLGTASGTVTNWDLSSFRFGASGDKAPGILTLRAKGDISLYGALSDGFQSAAYNAALMAPVTNLPLNAQSWSYRIVAGADLTAADALQVQAISALTPGKGSLNIGRFVESESPGGSGQSASTSLALAGNFQVIRTGSGDIDIAVGRDLRLLNQFATIYTAGTQVADPKLGGTFDTPVPSLTDPDNIISTALGNAQQSQAYEAKYSFGGGNITINAAGNIAHFKHDISKPDTSEGPALADDSSLEMPSNWLYRRGYVQQDGTFGTATVGTDVASTTWWIDFSNFFQGIGALGGGNIVMNAGGYVRNVDAVVPTNARMPKGTPDASKLVELGGGDLTIRAKGDIDAGVFYVERGHGTIQARGNITTNATRRATSSKTNVESRLPTTLFLGKGSFTIDARGDLLLGPISNPFMLPGGINNSVWYKTYFSTLSADSSVTATSLGGDITFRQAVVVSGDTSASPILLEWYRNILQFSTQNSIPSATQPWLRLNENDATPFGSLSTVGAASLSLNTISGNINLVGRYDLFPSARGNLTILSAGTVQGLRPLGTTGLNGIKTPQTVWLSSNINLSDADPAQIPTVSTPAAYRSFTEVDQEKTRADLNFLRGLSAPFQESGSLTSSLSTKQALHASNLLHDGDTNPVRIYAAAGDISGLTLFAPKVTRISASRDITDIALYLQNTGDEDLSIVSAGRDLLPYNANSPLRSLVNRTDNLIAKNQPSALAGDLQVAGPGTLEVLAGHDLRLGNGASAADGTGAGLVSIGNARNASLPFDGASIVAAAGIGPAFSLDSSKLDFDAFIKKFISGTDGARYLTALAAASDNGVSSVSEFDALTDDEQKRVALQVFFMVLRESGRDHNLAGAPNFGTYTAGTDAIKTLFPGTYQGNIETNSRDIRTKSGGDISLLIPGGSLALQTEQTGASLIPPGIVTESGGNIHIFTDQGVNIGISRIFTLRGGSQVIWASNGDIAAGSSSKTVQSAPPTRVLIDPTSANVATDLAGLATGGGIGVLATVAGIAPGSVDLIAVNGAIDAGDAGIRSTGNLNIAAVQILNANNISVGGTSSGTPAAPAVAAPGLGATASTSNASGAATQAGSTAANKPTEKQAPATDIAPSLITVEVLGYGGGEDSTDDEEEKRRKKAAEQGGTGAQIQ